MSELCQFQLQSNCCSRESFNNLSKWILGVWLVSKTFLDPVLCLDLLGNSFVLHICGLHWGKIQYNFSDTVWLWRPSSPWGLTSHPLPSQKLGPSRGVTIQTFYPPMRWFPQPSALNRTIPWVCLGACRLPEVQWAAQIAWGVENSSVTGVLLSAKPDGASPWLHYLCEIAFSPRKPVDLPPPSSPLWRNGQC